MTEQHHAGTGQFSAPFCPVAIPEAMAAALTPMEPTRESVEERVLYAERRVKRARQRRDLAQSEVEEAEAALILRREERAAWIAADTGPAPEFPFPACSVPACSVDHERPFP